MTNESATQVVIVTGASSGIGAATARILARQGYTVVLNARRGARLEAIASELTDEGKRVLVVPGDVTKPEDRRQLIATTISAFGRLDILINNAGGARSGSTEALPPDDVRLMFDLNVIAPIELTREAIPHLRRTRGTIINVASLAAFAAFPPVGVYSAAKAALVTWSDALRRELLFTGIHVSVVNPGPVKTEFGQVAGMGEDFTGRGISAQSVGRVIAFLLTHHRRQVSVPRLLGPVAQFARLTPWLLDAALSAAVRIRPAMASTLGIEGTAPGIKTEPAIGDADA